MRANRISTSMRRRANMRARRVAKWIRYGVTRSIRIGTTLLRDCKTLLRQKRPDAIPQRVRELFEHEAHTLAQIMSISFLSALCDVMGSRAIVLSAASRAEEVLRKQAHLTSQQAQQIRTQFDKYAAGLFDNALRPIEQRITRALADITARGLHVDEGVKQLRRTYDALGITPAHSYQIEAIYRTGTQMAYHAAQWIAAQKPEIQEVLWGWKYVTVGDDRVRPTHAALEGVTLPKDHSLWKRIFPPNGWGCRCSVIELFEPHEIVEPPPFVDVNGKSINVRPDKGFAFNPGEVFAEIQRILGTTDATSPSIERESTQQAVIERAEAERAAAETAAERAAADAAEKAAAEREAAERAAAEAAEREAAEKAAAERAAAEKIRQKPFRDAQPIPTFAPDELEALDDISDTPEITRFRHLRTGEVFRGVQWYDRAIVEKEMRVNALYRALGCPVAQDALFVTDRDAVVRLVREPQGEPMHTYFERASESERARVREQLQRHFVLDALLGNSGVVGKALCNVYVDSDGAVVRTNTATTFDTTGVTYGVQYTSFPFELFTMRDNRANEWAAQIFDGISDEQILAQLEDLDAKKNIVKSILSEMHYQQFVQRLDNALLHYRLRLQAITLTTEADDTRRLLGQFTQSAREISVFSLDMRDVANEYKVRFGGIDNNLLRHIKENDSLLQYCGSGYARINQQCRLDMRDYGSVASCISRWQTTEVGAQILDLLKMGAMMPPLENDMRVYRAEGLAEYMPDGPQFQITQFWSVSVWHPIDFVWRSEGLYEIMLPRYSQNVLRGMNPAELEFILMPGSTFSVIHRSTRIISDGDYRRSVKFVQCIYRGVR